MNYRENYLRDVKKEGIVEKKGRFDYISWAHAEKIGNELDPEFDWNTSFEFLELGLVEIEMKFKGKVRKHKYPILNNQNKPIQNPNSFDINNAQMRGFAKLFSMMTGIGLSLFTGEDLRFLDNANKDENKNQESNKDENYKQKQKQLIALVNLYVAEQNIDGQAFYKEHGIKKDCPIENIEKAIEDVKEKRLNRGDKNGIN